MQTRQYKTYISSLKGFACFFVMIGHYAGLVKYSQDLSESFSVFVFLEKFRLDFLYDESFWLQLFFVASGYLLAMSSIRNIRGFMVKSLTRFLRLALPILIANCIIIGIYFLIGFKNSETNILFQNEWFQNAYSTDLDFFLLLKSPIDTLLLSKCYFNSTYWVLRDMFLASMVIYAFLYVKDKINKDVFSMLVYSTVLILSLLFSKIIFVCLLGVGLALCEDIVHKFISQRISICILIGSFLSYILLPSKYTTILFFLCLIILVPQINFINRFLNLKFFDDIGKISFGIYVFHWPIICSVGAKILLVLSDVMGLGGALAIAVLVSVTLSLGLAVLFNKTAEKWCGKGIHWLQNKLLSI